MSVQTGMNMECFTIESENFLSQG